MRGEQTRQARGEQHVRHFFGFRRHQARARAGARDLEQRAGQPDGIARELHGRGIGQALAMPRHRRLQQAPEEHADVAQHHHRQRREHERARAVLAAAAA